MVDASQLVQVPPGFEAEWAGASASATEVVINVVRVGDALTTMVDTLVRGHGVPSPTAMIVLEVLRGAGEPLHPSTVADRCFLSRPALSSVMDTLERRGFVRRDVHAEDRRRVLVSITEAGRETMERLLPELHRAEAEWVSPLSAEDRARLLGLLGALQRQAATAAAPR